MKPARGLRVALILARFEALLLIRNVLVLAGMLAGGALIWSYIQPGEPLCGTPPGRSATGRLSWPSAS